MSSTWVPSGMAGKERVDGTDARQIAIGLLLLRLVGGGLLIHTRAWDNFIYIIRPEGAFPDPLGIGSQMSWALTVVCELLCSVMVVVGALTRATALPPMMLALSTGISATGPNAWIAQQMAILYALPFLVLTFTGAGRYSIDGKLMRQRH